MAKSKDVLKQIKKAVRRQFSAEDKARSGPILVSCPVQLIYNQKTRYLPIPQKYSPHNPLNIKALQKLQKV